MIDTMRLNAAPSSRNAIAKTPDKGASKSAVSNEEIWKTREQMAARYQVAVRTIDNWVEAGVLPVYKRGKVVRFDPLECDRAMRAFRRRSQFDDIRDGEPTAEYIPDDVFRTREGAGEDGQAMGRPDAGTLVRRIGKAPNQRKQKRQKQQGLQQPKPKLAGDLAGERRSKKVKKAAPNKAARKQSESPDDGLYKTSKCVKSNENAPPNGIHPSERTTKTTKTIPLPVSFLVSLWWN